MGTAHASPPMVDAFDRQVGAVMKFVCQMCEEECHVLVPVIGLPRVSRAQAVCVDCLPIARGLAQGMTPAQAVQKAGWTPVEHPRTDGTSRDEDFGGGSWL